MAAGTWTFFNSFKELVCDSTIDLDGHSFKALLLKKDYTPDLTDATVTDLSTGTNEASNYSRVALSGVTWTRSSGTCTWDCNDIVFTASGGPMVSKYVVIYDDDDASDSLVCYLNLDTSSGTAEISVSDTNTLTVVISSNGIFQLS